jgi:FkbM family methyltransferase
MHRFKFKNIFSYLIITLRLFFLVKRPFRILINYINETSPDFIILRNGIRIKTSSNPHDVITFILVFCRQDYGKIKKGSFIVDVGANIGFFTIYSLMNGAKNVEAFEPCEETFNVLEENIKFNKFDFRVKLHNLAVSELSNKDVFVPKKSSPYNKIHKENYLEKEMIKVKTINLEEALRSSAKIDLIKVDCEGAEFEIFSSLSTNFINKVDEIRMELHGSLEKFLSCFQSKSFRIYRKASNGEASDIWLTRI